MRGSFGFADLHGSEPIFTQTFDPACLELDGPGSGTGGKDDGVLRSLAVVVDPETNASDEGPNSLKNLRR